MVLSCVLSQIEAMVKAVMSQCDPDGDQTLSLVSPATQICVRIMPLGPIERFSPIAVDGCREGEFQLQRLGVRFVGLSLSFPCNACPVQCEESAKVVL